MSDSTTPAPAPSPAPAGPAQTLSIVSFVAGIVSIFVWAVPFFGFLVALAAIILGFIAKKREPAAPKWMTLVALILGFVSIVLSLIFIIIFIVGLIANAALVASVATIPGN